MGSLGQVPAGPIEFMDVTAVTNQLQLLKSLRGMVKTFTLETAIAVFNYHSQFAAYRKMFIGDIETVKKGNEPQRIEDFEKAVATLLKFSPIPTVNILNKLKFISLVLFELPRNIAKLSLDKLPFLNSFKTLYDYQMSIGENTTDYFNSLERAVHQNMVENEFNDNVEGRLEYLLKSLANPIERNWVSSCVMLDVSYAHFKYIYDVDKLFISYNAAMPLIPALLDAYKTDSIMQNCFYPDRSKLSWSLKVFTPPTMPNFVSITAIQNNGNQNEEDRQSATSEQSCSTSTFSNVSLSPKLQINSLEVSLAPRPKVLDRETSALYENLANGFNNMSMANQPTTSANYPPPVFQSTTYPVLSSAGHSNIALQLENIKQFALAGGFTYNNSNGDQNGNAGGKMKKERKKSATAKFYQPREPVAQLVVQQKLNALFPTRIYPESVCGDAQGVVNTLKLFYCFRTSFSLLQSYIASIAGISESKVQKLCSLGQKAYAEEVFNTSDLSFAAEHAEILAVLLYRCYASTGEVPGAKAVDEKLHFEKECKLKQAILNKAKRAPLDRDLHRYIGPYLDMMEEEKPKN